MKFETKNQQMGSISNRKGTIFIETRRSQTCVCLEKHGTNRGKCQNSPTYPIRCCKMLCYRYLRRFQDSSELKATPRPALYGPNCVRLEPVLIAVALSNLEPNASIDYSKMTPVFVKSGIRFVIGLILAIASLQGGYKIFHQTDLRTARQVAILFAIPCCGTCLFPVGIWACVLLYGKNAKRDFGG